MKGKILGFESAAGTGAINGEDGKRYKFIGADWRAPRPAKPGEEVDFEVGAEGTAIEIYPLKTSAGLDLNDVRDRMKGAIGNADLSNMGDKAKQMLAAGSASPAGAHALSLLKARLSAGLALVILVASVLLSFIAIGAKDAPMAGGSALDQRHGYSALGISGFVHTAKAGLADVAQGMDIGQSMIDMMPPSAREMFEREKSALGSAKFAASMLYIVFLIPLGAAGLLFLEWRNRPDDRASLALGGLCILGFLATLYMRHAFAGVFGVLLDSGRQFGGPDDASIRAAYPGPALGAYIVLLCGIGLILNALGFVRLGAPAPARA